MPVYKAPLRDMMFVLKDVIGTEKLRQYAQFSEVSDDLIEAILTEGAKFSENVLTPLNMSGDQEGCHWNDGVVTTPKGFKEAYQEYVNSGWPSLAADPAYGGQGLPNMVSLFFEEMICSSNLAFGLYPGLTRGASILLQTHGSQELKDIYLEKLLAGAWAGTMCLTEAHCGTDLGLLRTKAELQADGSYKLTGTKIFISSGEHDLTENIIHFVIARTPDAPEGIKGISLFLVPKFMVKKDGSLGERNPVHCASIEHKMGIKASSTCVMNFDGAVGYLVGDLHKGINNMFTMMNVERLGVGIQGLGIGEVVYQNALKYARERLQGRALTGPAQPSLPADPLITHPDIRRMLLTMKSMNEGCRLLEAWIAQYLDIDEQTQDPEEQQEADDLIQLMTPVIKAFLTDVGTRNANLGMQIYGGHGYIQEWGMEQFVRDVRIAQIYEGTNGIQALDLIGRKMPAHAGRYLRRFFHPVQQFIEKYKDDQSMEEFIGPLFKAFGRLQQATLVIAQRSMRNPNEAGAAANDFLRLFALVAVAYLWCRTVLVAREKLAQDRKQDGDIFYESKIHTARFFMQKVLPESSSLFANIMAGASSVMSMDEKMFGEAS